MKALLQTLFDRAPAASERSLTPELRELYDGTLQLAGEEHSDPYVVANFVTTLDGVVSYKIPGQAGGAAISGADEADRFIMGLLRASVDAVMIGAGNVRDASSNALLTPEFVYPAAAQLYADYRRSSGHQRAQPLAVIVSGSGQLCLDRAVFRTPGVPAAVMTTAAGRERLDRLGASEIDTIEVHTLPDAGGYIRSSSIIELLRDLGVRRLLHEGGPLLLGSFLADGAVNELFLTLSPQIAGRSEQGIRPGLVEGLQFLPAAAPWLELLSAKRRSDHLYLRYRYRPPAKRGGAPGTAPVP